MSVGGCVIYTKSSRSSTMKLYIVLVLLLAQVVNFGLGYDLRFRAQPKRLSIFEPREEQTGFYTKLFGLNRFPDFRARSSLQASEPAKDYDGDEHYQEFKNALLKENHLQSGRLAEEYLKGFDSVCLQRFYCSVARDHESSTAKAAMTSVEVLREMLGALYEADEENSLSMETVKGLVAAYDLGAKSDDSNICRWVFPCQVPREQIQGRSTCATIGLVCPGASIGCALCGVFSPDTCGTVCNMAAVYCGVSTYSCMIATAAHNNNATNKTMGSARSFNKPNLDNLNSGRVQDDAIEDELKELAREIEQEQVEAIGIQGGNIKKITEDLESVVAADILNRKRRQVTKN